MVYYGINRIFVGVYFMGAYGSPDLNEQKPKPQPFQPPVYQSPYQQTYQQPPKQADSNNYQCPYMQAYLELRDQHVAQHQPKEEKHGCLLTFIVVFAIVIGIVIGYAIGFNNALGRIPPPPNSYTTQYK